MRATRKWKLVGGIREAGTVGSGEFLWGGVTPGADDVSWLFFSPLNGDGFDLGPIFPQQLSGTEVDSAPSLAWSSQFGRFGSRGSPIGFRGPGICPDSPEPAAKVLAGMSLFGLDAARRRRAWISLVLCQLEVLGWVTTHHIEVK